MLVSHHTLFRFGFAVHFRFSYGFHFALLAGDDGYRFSGVHGGVFIMYFMASKMGLAHCTDGHQQVDGFHIFTLMGGVLLGGHSVDSFHFLPCSMIRGSLLDSSALINNVHANPHHRR